MNLPDLPRECPIGIPPVRGVENRALSALRTGDQSLVVGDRDVEAVITRLALEKEDRHLPQSLSGMLVEVGQGPVLLEAGSNLFHDVLCARRIHRPWLLDGGERWWRVGERGARSARAFCQRMSVPSWSMNDRW